MKREAILFGICIAIAVAAYVTFVQYRSSEQPYVDALIKLQLDERLEDRSELFVRESPGIQALMLHYSDDDSLVLRTRIALNEFPDTAEEVLLTYGADPDFKEVFDEYGETIIPVIQYFIENDLIIDELLHDIQRIWASLWAIVSSNNDDKDLQSIDLSSEARGALSIAMIQDMGHGLLGQFVANDNGQIERVRTEQTLEIISGALADGIRTVEEKYRAEENVEIKDILWATADVAALTGALALVSRTAGTLKLMRATKEVVRSGKRLSVTRTSATIGARLLSSAGKVAPRVAKYGVPLATILLIVKHPNLLNSLFAEVGVWLSLPQWLSQISLWMLLLFILLIPLSWVLVPALRMLIRILEISVSILNRPRVEKASVDAT